MTPTIHEKKTLWNERALVSEQVNIPEPNGNLSSAIFSDLKDDFLFLSTFVFIHKNETLFFDKLWTFGKFVLVLQDKVKAFIK